MGNYVHLCSFHKCPQINRLLPKNTPMNSLTFLSWGLLCQNKTFCSIILFLVTLIWYFNCTWLGVDSLFSRARLWPSTPRWKLFLLILSSDSDLDNFSSSPFSSPLDSFFWFFFFLLFLLSLALLELSLDVSEELSEMPVILLLPILVYSAAANAITCRIKGSH